MKPVIIVMIVLFALSLIYAVQGVIMHTQVNAEEDRFHALQKDYFTIDKATRDGASTGSDLNSQLVEIKNTPSNLLRLKLVGVGKILTGIYILLFGILIALLMMPARLAHFIKKGKK